MSQNHYYMPLPRQAGFVITSIGGKRCTAVPRSVQQSSKPVTTTQPARTTAGTPARTSDNANNNPPTESTPARDPVVPTSDRTDTTLNRIATTATPLTSIPTPEAINDTSISQSARRPTQTPATPGETNNDSNSSTPQDSSSIRLPSSTSSNRNNDPANTDQAAGDIGSRSSVKTGAIAGGVMGVLIILAILGIILFFCRRRRKQRKQEAESLMSPLPSSTREKFYEIDKRSLGPSRKTTKWKQEISSRAENAAYGLKMTMGTLRDTVSRDRSDTPSIDLDRGNSQFFAAGAAASHSRNNSVLTEQSKTSFIRDRLSKWRGRFGEVWQPQKQGGRMRGSTSQRASMVESLVNTHERYRDSDQSGSVTTSNLGLTLMNSQTSDLLRLENQPRDPFEDPYADEDPFRDPKFEATRALKPSDLRSSTSSILGHNPFSDPVVTVPSSSIPKPQTYIQHVRRSRSSSFSSGPSSNRSSRNSDLISFKDRPTSMTVTSPRVPSAFAPSHVSDRDTIYSSFSAERRGKGRSDPFDLDRADLYSRLSPKNRPKPAEPSLESANSAGPSISRIKSMIAENKARAHHRYNSSIRYSSGVDSLEDWGAPEDEGPDSMRGNASSRASERDYGKNDVRHGRADSEVGVPPMGVISNHKINGSLVEIKVNVAGGGAADNAAKELEKSRQTDNVSPINEETRRELEKRRQRDNVSPVSAVSID